MKTVLMLPLLLLGGLAACGTQKDSVDRVGLKPLDVRDSTFGSGDALGNGGTGTSTATGGSGTNPGGATSVGLFATTVYPYATKWCAGCHATVQTPYFAQATVQTAHDDLLAAQKVDFTNPANSRLVLRLTVDQHNCPQDIGCAAAGAEMLQAIKDWAAGLAAQTANTPQLPTTTTLKLADAVAKTVPGSNPAGVMMFQADAFTIKAPMVKTVLATASDGFTVNVPANATAVTNATQAAANAALGSMTMTFNVTAAGNYVVQGLVNGATATNAEFFIKMDAGTLTPWIFKPTAANYVFVGAAPTAGGTPTQYALTAGSHTLVIMQSRPGASVDKVVLSSVAGFDPASAQPATRNVQLLTFDLSSITKVAGTALTVEITDYSQNAYLFANPTLVVPSGSLYVKDLRLLVNGDFLAQNATYTVIDKTVAAPGGVLSTSALVALKDQGNAADQFSFAFETIQAK